jgi:hypothetical protein
MHKIILGQSQCIDLLKRIIRNFSLYFSEFPTNLGEFWKFD